MQRRKTTRSLATPGQARQTSSPEGSGEETSFGCKRELPSASRECLLASVTETPGLRESVQIQPLECPIATCGASVRDTTDRKCSAGVYLLREC
ncbi:Protein Translation Initiation Factor 2 subunit gamma (IF-2g) [Giardia duodenalis]|uniref:Protein Translation Initiation Factor 2 subunit gamma (IF-2g) n=1 Tax=Giardia intestinalis TaxID=5741 RepID=V6TRJ3_GIAIN|nr:Protein Translation Initiation Factor 2 subunit gamma (IF-2g) [Giardia intestinalis]